MVAFLFYYEDVSTGTKSGADIAEHVWRGTFQAFGFDSWIMIDNTEKGFNFEDAGMHFERYTSLEQAQTAHPKVTWVYLSPERSIPGAPGYKGRSSDPHIKYEYLHDFKHPKDNVIYVVGSDMSSLPIGNMVYSSRKKLVAIKTASANFILYAFPAAAIVSYDRFSKLI